MKSAYPKTICAAVVCCCVFFGLLLTHSAKAQGADLVTIMSGQNYSEEHWPQEFCSVIFEFCVPLHKNYWYNSFTDEDEDFGHVEFGMEQIESEGDGPIAVHIKPGVYTGTPGAAEQFGDQLVLKVARNSDSHFSIEGSAILRIPLEYMATHIRSENKAQIKSPATVTKVESSTETSEDEFLGAVSIGEPTFPDVSAEHPHFVAIETLFDWEVVRGNPDGNYYPNRTLNRAEVLVMLYRALGKEPASPAAPCFDDVPTDVWFAAVVCHAALSGYVQGYGGGLFGPENPVTRTQAIKMVLEVLDIDLAQRISLLEQLNYADVDLKGWYALYLETALLIGTMEKPTGINLYPHEEISRGEIAAYIYNTLAPEVEESEPKEAATESSEEVTGEPEEVREVDEPTAEREPRQIPTLNVNNTEFSYVDEGDFDNRNAIVYKLDVKTPTTLSIVSLLDNNVRSGTCRLYRLEDNGFSDEYHLGILDKSYCRIQSALTPGRYQLELHTTVADAGYSVAISHILGDDNNGFSEAVFLRRGSAVSDLLEEGDLEDWYTFTVSSPITINAELTGQGVECLVYAMNDVDLFGFANPECNINFEYPEGTYFITVRKIGDHREQQSYNLRLR